MVAQLLKMIGLRSSRVPQAFAYFANVWETRAFFSLMDCNTSGTNRSVLRATEFDCGPDAFQLCRNPHIAECAMCGAPGCERTSHRGLLFSSTCGEERLRFQASGLVFSVRSEQQDANVFGGGEGHERE